MNDFFLLACVFIKTMTKRKAKSLNASTLSLVQRQEKFSEK
jgi:hypothetical protein